MPNRKNRKKKLKLDLEFDEEKKPQSFMSKLKGFGKTDSGKRVPITFNVGIAIILFFVYVVITFLSLTMTPILLLILLPTLYVLLRYIKLERSHHAQNDEF